MTDKEKTIAHNMLDTLLKTKCICKGEYDVIANYIADLEKQNDTFWDMFNKGQMVYVDKEGKR